MLTLIILTIVGAAFGGTLGILQTRLKRKTSELESLNLRYNLLSNRHTTLISRMLKMTNDRDDLIDSLRHQLVKSQTQSDKLAIKEITRVSHIDLVDDSKHSPSSDVGCEEKRSNVPDESKQ